MKEITNSVLVIKELNTSVFMNTKLNIHSLSRLSVPWKHILLHALGILGIPENYPQTFISTWKYTRIQRKIYFLRRNAEPPGKAACPTLLGRHRTRTLPEWPQPVAQTVTAELKYNDKNEDAPQISQKRKVSASSGSRWTTLKLLAPQDTIRPGL